jgi:hypothetical protein
MNTLRDNPNLAKTTSILLLGAIGAVSCGSSEEAKIVETEITPMSAVYEWPLMEVEVEPSEGFELVQTIDRSFYSCTLDFDGNPKCSTTYDEDYIGYNRQPIPIDSNSSQPLKLEGREFVGSLEIPPRMYPPADNLNTVYSVESYYAVKLNFTVNDSDKIMSCKDNIYADQYNEQSIRRALTGEVTYNDSWGDKSIQFKRDGNLLLEIDC